MSPSLEEVQRALDLLSKVNFDTFADNDVARKKVLEQAVALSRRLEGPIHMLDREMWIQPSISTAIKIGQDLKVFHHLSELRPGLTLEALARKTKSNPELLQRILRLLSSVDFIEYDADRAVYRGTTTSEAFTKPGWVGGMTHLFTQVWPCYAGLPSFLQQTNYQSPTDIANGPWQHGLGTSETFFEWMTAHPLESTGFNDLMACHPTAVSWTDVYPIATLAQTPPEDPSTPLVVDLGGGTGRDMRRVRDALKPATFKFQVQDMASAVEQGRAQAENADSIEFVAHDFFQAQPVRGARAYFMQNILHDWPDHLAIEILRNIAAAMKPGYSRLLITERVVPEGRVPPAVAALDLLMMGLVCAKERTEKEWKTLIADAGLKLEKIWTSQDETRTAIIEAVLV